MNILILGHSGFVGKHLCNYLGLYFNITTASRTSGDILIDLTNINQYDHAFKDLMFDVIICTAVSYSPHLPIAIDNAIIATNVMDYFQDKVKQILFVSSVSALSENKDLSTYNFSKYLEEEIIQHYYKIKGNVTTLRFCQIIDHNGESRKSQSGFHYIIDSINSNSDLNLFTLNDSPRSYISIEALTDVVAYTIDKAIYGFHNIVFEPNLTLTQTVELLLSAKKDYNAQINYINKEAMHYNIPKSSDRFLEIMSQHNIADYLIKFIK